MIIRPEQAASNHSRKPEGVVADVGPASATPGRAIRAAYTVNMPSMDHPHIHSCRALTRLRRYPGATVARNGRSGRGTVARDRIHGSWDLHLAGRRLPG